MTIDEEQATGEAMIRTFELTQSEKQGEFMLLNQSKTPVGVCRTIQRIYDLKGAI